MTTPGFESAKYFGVFTLPAGVTVSGLSLVLSLLVFPGVSWVTRREAGDIDAGVKLVVDT